MNRFGCFSALLLDNKGQSVFSLSFQLSVQPPQQRESAWRVSSFTKEEQFVRNTAATVGIAGLHD